MVLTSTYARRGGSWSYHNGIAVAILKFSNCNTIHCVHHHHHHVAKTLNCSLHCKCISESDSRAEQLLEIGGGGGSAVTIQMQFPTIGKLRVQKRLTENLQQNRNLSRKHLIEPSKLLKLSSFNHSASKKALLKNA